MFVLIEANSEELSGYQEVRQLIGGGKYSQAVKFSKELVKANPDYLPIYEALVDAAYYGKTLSDATAFFFELVQDGTGQEMAFYGAGLVQFCERKYRSAALLFEKAIALGCASPDCYKMLEYSYEKASGEDAAIRLFSFLCNRNPENPNNWYGLALAYWEKKDGNTIMTCLKEAIRRKPGESRYMQALAAAMSLYGDERLARSAIEYLLAALPPKDDYQGYFFLQAHKVQLLAKMGLESGDNSTMNDLAELANRNGFHRWEGWCYLKQADLDYERGVFTKSILSARKASLASDIAHDSDLRVASLGRIFESHLELGMIGEAIEDGLLRIRCLENEGSQRQIVKAFLDLGRAYQEIGQCDLSLDYLSEALSRTASLEKDTIIQIQLRAAMGLAYEGLGKLSEAMSSFELALSLLPSKRVWTQMRAQVCGELGKCFLLTRQYRAANQYYATQRRLVNMYNLSRIEPELYANLGDYFEARGNMKRASDCYEKAYEKADSMNLKRLVARSLRGVARTKVKLHDTERALKVYSALLSLLENQSRPRFEEVSSFAFDREFRNDFEDYARLLLKVGDSRGAFKISELMRLRESIDPFSIPLCKLHGPPFDSLVYQATLMRERIGTLYYDFTNASRKSLFEERHLRNIEFRGQIAELEIAFERLLDRIYSKSELSRELVLPQPIEISRLQHSLRESESAVLEYFVGRGGTIAFVITADTISAYEINVTSDSLNVLLAKLTSLLDNKKELEAIWTPILANYDSATAMTLYKLFVRQAMPLIRNVGRLTIVADEGLRNLPFEIMQIVPLDVDQEKVAAKKIFLVERFEINYSLSASSIPNFATSLPVGRILAIGSDFMNRDVDGLEASKMGAIESSSKQSESFHLPGVRDEINRIKKVLGSDLVVTAGPRYRKEDFFHSVQAFDVIHIASHSIWNRQYPSVSSVRLNEIGSSLRDGEILAYEFSELDLRAHLLVLSACNSARWSSEARNYGFLRGVFGGGAVSMLGAVWPIEDEATAKLMEAFYANMKLGMRVGRALQLAKIELIESGKRDPFFWGGFILVGPNVSIQISESNVSKSDWGALIGTGCALIVLFAGGFLTRHARKYQKLKKAK